MFASTTQQVEGVSAVKALSLANATGQRIYHITQVNKSSALPNIHHSAETMTEINNALNAGKEVITHTDTITLSGWSGAGYVIFDPEYGDGAYKISGGTNGGFLELLEYAEEVFWSALGELDSVAAKAIAGLKTLYDHILNIIDIVMNCSTGTAIAAIISITLVIVGFMLLAPAFAAFGYIVAVGYATFSGLSTAALSAGWIRSCK